MAYKSDYSTNHTSHEIIVDDEEHPIDYEYIEIDKHKTATEEELRQQMEELILTTLYKELKESKDELRRQLDVIQTNKELIALSEDRYRTLVNNSQDVIYSCDCSGAFTTINEKFCEVIGFSKEIIIGKTINDIHKDPGYIKEWNNIFSNVINNGEAYSFTYQYERKVGSGVIGYYNETLSPLFDLAKNIIGVIGTNQDITALKENETRIKHMAYYDYITDLPSRNHFLERLDNAIKLSKKKAAQLIIVILNLDNFKSVNNTLGRAMGDVILIETSTRLLKCIAGKDTVARLDGDEFALLLENVEHEDELVYLLKRINLAFEEPFKIKNGTIILTASLGVSIYPEDGDTNEELITNATTAMYKAKKVGENNCQFFDFKMKHEFLQKTKIERLLRKAIINDEFVLHYQPQYTVTGKLRGFEALIRWASPEMGFLYPMEFIPIAEATGLIIPIGEWVLNTAILTCKRYVDKYACELIMGINISPIQLRQREFSEIVMKALQSSELKPTSLELEVTESSFIDDYDSVANELRTLKDLGVSIALDDFGTGYSSLSYLKSLPIALLKIDKSFVQAIDFLNPHNDLTESIIALVNKLNIKTIAEGVETLEQLEYLSRAKCDYIQGYYLGKPGSEALIDDILEKAFPRV